VRIKQQRREYVMTTVRSRAELDAALVEQRRMELENAARAAIGDREYFQSPELEKFTGTPASTWRYWAGIGKGPESFLLGKRRVWARTSLLRWLIAQEFGGPSSVTDKESR
jgi:prophage regulatory protein